LPIELGHDWDITPKEAVARQKRLRHLVVEENRLGKVELIAGVDVGYRDSGRTAHAAIAVLHYPELEPVEFATATMAVHFPYIPGLLSFREVPVVLKALENLQKKPDLLICDGQGQAHLRRLGLACHIGILTGLPTIGAAKSRLCGRFDPPGEEKGSWAPLYDREDIIGVVLRTRNGKKPLFVSIGHKVNLETAREWVLRCLTRYRLPETTRWAHRIASESFEPGKEKGTRPCR
jgi:deoxyribonuclease V